MPTWNRKLRFPIIFGLMWASDPTNIWLVLCSFTLIGQPLICVYHLSFAGIVLTVSLVTMIGSIITLGVSDSTL